MAGAVWLVLERYWGVFTEASREIDDCCQASLVLSREKMSGSCQQIRNER